MLVRFSVIAAVSLFLIPSARADQALRESAVGAIKRAAEFYRGQVASHGGYVYHYSLDLRQRWGEGIATEDQIWVQPPGTPTVGMAYLRAYQATGDSECLEAATEAAVALVYGQLKSGGWTNLVDFDSDSPHVSDYRNGRGGGKNNSSLDDGQTQSAIRLLVQVDGAHHFKHAAIHQAAIIGLDALLRAQFANGAFPQVWTGPVQSQPILKASYPEYDWRTEGRIKNYWDMYTLNDDVAGYVAATLIDAYRIYNDDRYLQALKKLGDFLIVAQMPDPQPGWAQQYNYEMKPIWARKFEPPAVSGDETQEVIETLIEIAAVTGDRKYLAPIGPAANWLRRSLLADGRLARYYELRSNRPLYMNRKGDQYSLTYDDSRLPSHYGWKTESRLSDLGKRFARARAGKSPEDVKPSNQLASLARKAIQALDDQGRWISTYDGQRLVGQAKMPLGTQYLSSQVFSDNLTLLSDYIASSNR